MMKPKALTEHEEGMLEYLEDIIGSSIYKEPIEVIAKEVEQLNEQRGEKVCSELNFILFTQKVPIIDVFLNSHYVSPYFSELENLINVDTLGESKHVMTGYCQ